MASSAATPTSLARKKGGKRPQESEPISGLKLMAELVEAEAPLTKKSKTSGETSSSKAIDGGINQKYHNKENMHENRQVLVLDWTPEDLGELVNKISTQLPKNDSSKYSTLMEKLDWDKVSFGPYTAGECKEKFHQILSRLRRFRTMTELVSDAKEWLKNPCVSFNQAKKLQAKHPDLPKKPLTPYFRYFLEKRAKYQKLYPQKSVTELAKFISQKFAKLPAHKMQALKDQYQNEMAEYKQKVEQFKIDHPTLSKTLEQQVANGKREKPHTPYQLFLMDRLNRSEFAQMDKKEASEKIKKLWANLSDGKRVKWIRRAVQAEHDLLKELPDGYKGILTKSEKELKDRYDGKPERPPNSGYSLFSKIKLRELKNVPSKEKMAEISRQWKNLSEADREGFNKEALKANLTYKESYNTYLLNLGEEERLRSEQDQKSKKKQEDDSGLITYQLEMLPNLYENHPDLSREEGLKILEKEYNSLSKQAKAKYMTIDTPTAEKTTGKENISTKKVVFKGEPKKPPQSGYGVFSTEMLSKLTAVDSRLRMQEIAKLWNKMSDEEKDAYKARGKEMMKKYNQDLKKFLMSLSPAELELYKQTRCKGGNSKAVTTETKQTLSKKASSSGSSSSSESEGESSSDESSNSGEDDNDEEDSSSSGSSEDDEVSSKKIKEEPADEEEESSSSGDDDDDEDQASSNNSSSGSEMDDDDDDDNASSK